MILDMHVHTQISLDATATVEEYCEAILKYRESFPIDGFVLTEHRVIDRSIDYRKLGDRYGIQIFQGWKSMATSGTSCCMGSPTSVCAISISPTDGLMTERSYAS